MRLQNTSAQQDEILSSCESFGGLAQEAVEIACDLDKRLTESLDKIEELEKEIKSE